MAAGEKNINLNLVRGKMKKGKENRGKLHKKRGNGLKNASF